MSTVLSTVVPLALGAAISPVVGEAISDLAALRDKPDVFD